MNFVQEQGFQIIPDIFGADRIHSITEAVNSTVRRSRAGIRHALEIPQVRDLANEDLLVSFAAQAIGARAVPFRATLFDKSPQSNWLVVWHQDATLPLRARVDTHGWGPWSIKEDILCAHAPSSASAHVLAIRVHLDDSNEDNGSLRVLPKTHKLGVLTDAEIEILATRVSAINCHVTRGGILLMNPLLVHSSSKVRSAGARRRVLHIEYASQTTFPGGIELRVC